VEVSSGAVAWVERIVNVVKLFVSAFVIAVVVDMSEVAAGSHVVAAVVKLAVAATSVVVTLLPVPATTVVVTLLSVTATTVVVTLLSVTAAVPKVVLCSDWLIAVGAIVVTTSAVDSMLAAVGCAFVTVVVIKPGVDVMARPLAIEVVGNVVVTVCVFNRTVAVSSTNVNCAVEAVVVSATVVNWAVEDVVVSATVVNWAVEAVVVSATVVNWAVEVVVVSATVVNCFVVLLVTTATTQQWIFWWTVAKSFHIIWTGEWFYC
jgi:hypothetical protein